MTYYFPSPHKALRILVVLLLLPFCLLGGNKHIFHLTNGLNSAEVPFTLIENLIVVQVILASEKPMNFIIDNGTFSAVIFDANYIKDLSLPLGSRITFRGAGVGKPVQATVVQGTSLHLSGVATDYLGMVVLDENPFRNVSFDDTEVHGVLGATLFQSFVVEIDYPARVLRFHKHENFRPPASFNTLPMKVVNGKPYLSGRIQGKNVTLEAHLMLDLGFNNALMLQMKDSLVRETLTHRMVSKIGMGYSGAVSGRVGRTDMVQIGSRQIPKVPTIAPFYDSYPLVYLSPGVQRLGSVGNALFLDTSIILNYPDEIFYIQGEEPYVAEQENEIPLPPHVDLEKAGDLIF